ncbi:MAG: hypothetical protein RL653_1009 [Pseudomonadota bacterium]|jgi:MoxR-like ATPase
MSTSLQLHGAKLTSQQLHSVLQHLFETNLANEEQTGERPTPVCIWGLHGIGKTHAVQAFARERGWKLAYCAPAQFEEMGDLHGLPTRLDPDPTVQGDEVTVYLPPEWVPNQPGPGILLLDDVNRADDRILRGLMQLLQNFEMFSWQLPAKWQIVCTANPEGGDYSVTPMDDAMLTRMVHVALEFDVKAWAAWATSAGVDPRGIAFVLTYPETVTGKRTTARSLTQFFSQIRSIPDLKAKMDLVNVLARGTLDDVTASAFMAFVADQLEQLISPEDILDAKDYAPVGKRISALAKGKGDSKRVDRLATICTRLFLHVTAKTYKAGKTHKENLVSFLLHEDMPADLRFSLHRDLVAAGAETAALVRDPRLAKAVLGSM